MGLYIARDRNTTVISRAVLHVHDGRRVRRSWSALVETRVPERHTPPDRSVPVVVAIGLPPVLVTLIALRFLGIELAIVLGVFLLLTLISVVPAIHGRRARRSRQQPGPDARRLTAAAERTAFDRAVAIADRISETWPALGNLVDVPAAEALLADALWEITGLLVRRQELSAVLADLTRPDFVGLSPADGTAERLQAQIRATKQALSGVEIDLAGREASLRRAEEAGRTFIREREMRQAIQAAERSLGTQPEAARPADPAADLAEQTQLVLSAYRELTAGLRPD
ncbi:hypothetical protein BJ973_008578 [Actinoplanes tereljensis]|uniref:Uncharacterized protein n=1 Tax=Paractinoplanes tereljensis TaxID=571912 RepID=A0A919NI29_9ACTN|nr:hypothetical protein [Actinoplanes tereljensis]GIF18464.1 hypothetical protein Ate02nite_11940 [Actinoplanes tereljensis]